jgi:predicted dehydrogenase
LHLPHALAALRAGKHVMCEKPLAMDALETATLVQEAQKCNRVGGVTYNQRYYPLCQEAHALVRSGAIGEPRLVHGTFLQDWLLYPSDWNWRLETQQGGTMRAVSDIGTHWLDLMMWITGRRVVELCADLATVIPVRRRPLGRVETFQKSELGAFEEVQMTSDDYASILLHFEGGVRGVMTVSQVSAGRKNRLWFEVDGSEGALSWNAEEPNVLWLGSRNAPNRILLKNPALMTPEASGYAAYPGGHGEGYPDTFLQLFKDFYAYIEAGSFTSDRTFPTFETGHTEVALCDAIAASARDRRWVSFP